MTAALPRITSEHGLDEVNAHLEARAAATDQAAADLDPSCTYVVPGDGAGQGECCGADGTIFEVRPGRIDLDSSTARIDPCERLLACPAHLPAAIDASGLATGCSIVTAIAEVGR